MLRTGSLGRKVWNRWRWTTWLPTKGNTCKPPKKVEGIRKSCLSSWPKYVFFYNCKENPMGNGSQISVKRLQFDSCLQNVPVWISWGCLRRGYFGACPKPRCCKWRGNLTTCKQVSNMLEHVAVLKPFLVVTENASRHGLLWGDMNLYYIYIYILDLQVIADMMNIYNIYCTCPNCIHYIPVSHGLLTSKSDKSKDLTEISCIK